MLCASALAHRPLRLVLDLEDALCGPRAQRETDALDPTTRALLSDLARRERTTVLLLSRRSRRYLGALGELPLWMAAEGGAFVRPPGGPWRALFPPPPELSLVRSMLASWCARWPGSVCEPREHSVAWHFYCATPAPSAEALRSLVEWFERVARAGGHEVRLRAGSVEVRPAGLSPARAVEALSRSEGFEGACTLVLGDPVLGYGPAPSLSLGAVRAAWGEGARLRQRDTLPDHRSVERLLREFVA